MAAQLGNAEGCVFLRSSNTSCLKLDWHQPAAGPCLHAARRAAVRAGRLCGARGGRAAPPVLGGARAGRVCGHGHHGGGVAAAGGAARGCAARLAPGFGWRLGGQAEGAVSLRRPGLPAPGTQLRWRCTWRGACVNPCTYRCPTVTCPAVVRCFGCLADRPLQAGWHWKCMHAALLAPVRGCRLGKLQPPWHPWQQVQPPPLLPPSPALQNVPCSRQARIPNTQPGSSWAAAPLTAQKYGTVVPQDSRSRSILHSVCWQPPTWCHPPPQQRVCFLQLSPCSSAPHPRLTERPCSCWQWLLAVAVAAGSGSGSCWQSWPMPCVATTTTGVCTATRQLGTRWQAGACPRAPMGNLGGHPRAPMGKLDFQNQSVGAGLTQTRGAKACRWC